MPFQPKPPDERHDRNLTVPLTDALVERLDGAAQVFGLSRTAMARALIADGLEHHVEAYPVSGTGALAYRRRVPEKTEVIVQVAGETM